MKRIIILLLAIGMVRFNLYAINSHSFEKIKTISIGEGKEQIGFSNSELPSYGYIKPQVFEIYEKQIYIFDLYNARMQVLDLNLNYLTTFKTTYNMIEVRHFKVDTDGSIFGISADGLVHISNKGDEISFEKRDTVPKAVLRNNFFIFKHQVLTYNNDNTINNPQLAEELRNEFPNTIRNDSGLKDKFDDFIINNNLIIKGNRLLNADMYYHIKIYFSFLRDNIKDRKLKPGISEELFYKVGHLMGFDAHDNGYWIGVGIIFVFSKYGELIDYFYYDVDEDTHGYPKVDESTGDLYYWNVKKTGVTFYRLKNTWDPIEGAATTKTTDASTIPQPVAFAARASSVTATSYVDYQSQYNPYRVFDGDPKTAWLEAVKGSSIDQSVTLTLDKDVFVDEIRFSPGLFDPKWWKANNRIKKLAVEASGKLFTFDFEDKMEEQAKKLPAPLKLGKIKLTIKEVHRSTGDDDTALSEVAFYSGGKRLEIDVSGVK